MSFDWNYLFSLFSNADFWQATWTVIKLSLLSWIISIGLVFFWRWASRLPLPGSPYPRGHISGCFAACRCWCC
ncbi:Uncharacterised protein [Cedecea neteri]|uniref:Uncharacterized protein n=1 Tax=Cedecea neteri TaxID=158822 RepID=A0A2X3IW60_9ENTR|nr:Uncharacterised protein [Cedecea neteri]